MLRNFTIVLLICSISVVLVICISEFAANYVSKWRYFSKIEEIPSKKVGLLLGTWKFLPDGRQNLFYIYRIQATIKLYQAGKIKKVLISGDNSKQNYDEPTMMKDDLVAAGIPQTDITLDFAGFRTLDSVVRAKEVFGADDIIIISQKFHIIRAIVIGKFYGINAIWYEAQAVPNRLAPRMLIREPLARIKMWIDICTRKQPRFLGKKENIQ